ncbi:hypothetical protein [Corynebacterium bovis]|uniref:hypothetical protein n=1 Tax=Corynebacterium bovis TaxID=36808 RepID=UPI003138B4FB
MTCSIHTLARTEHNVRRPLQPERQHPHHKPQRTITNRHDRLLELPLDSITDLLNSLILRSTNSSSGNLGTTFNQTCLSHGTALKGALNGVNPYVFGGVQKARLVVAVGGLFSPWSLSRISAGYPDHRRARIASRPHGCAAKRRTRQKHRHRQHHHRARQYTSNLSN